jgi:thiol-disulfide isomerase/thioredoxin
VLSYFDGARPLIAEIALRQDGTLALTLSGPRQPARQLVAVRAAEARTQGLPQPDDPAEHTGWKDPNQPLRFSFPDIDGHIVSNTDPRFKDKVIIVSVTGSWCPNCHDEAPFLVDLYRRYHPLGLEIVALDFEEPEQLATKTRPRAFVAKYGIKYAYLIAGEPKDLQEKIPQAENLNCWPTTFFVGRDGKVRAAHAGFAAAASGEFHTQLEREVTGLVERLLAEPDVNASAALK